MGFASKYNKTRKFDIDTNGFEFAAPADLFNQNGKDYVYPIRAMFINTKGKYNDNPVVATDSFFVDFPAHMCDTCREILNDDEAVAAIWASSSTPTFRRSTTGSATALSSWTLPSTQQI